MKAKYLSLATNPAGASLGGVLCCLLCLLRSLVLDTEGKHSNTWGRRGKIRLSINLLYLYKYERIERSNLDNRLLDGGFLLVLGGADSLFPLGFSHLRLLVPLCHDILGTEG